MIDELCDSPEKHAFLHAGGGHAVIYGPTAVRWPRSFRPIRKVFYMPISISA